MELPFVNYIFKLRTNNTLLIYKSKFVLRNSAFFSVCYINTDMRIYCHAVHTLIGLP